MTIREYAKAHDHEIVGKLTRRPELERYRSERFYIDEAGNEYITNHHYMVIITADGAVI